MRILVAALLAISLVVAGLLPAASEDLPPAGELPTSISVPVGNLLFAHNFKDGLGIYREADNDSYTQQLRDGAWHITIKKVNWTSWNSAPSNKSTDFVAETVAFGSAGPDNNGYGLMFRKVDNDNYYRCQLSTAGSYQCIKKQDGKWFNIKLWTPSGAINKGKNQKNTIAVVGIGDRFAFYVNGQVLADFTDSAFSEGQIAIVGSTYSELNVDVAFESIKVWEAAGLPATAVETTPPVEPVAPNPEPSPVTPPTPPSPTAIASGEPQVLFFDDFSSATTKFSLVSGAYYTRTIKDGTYRWTANSAAGTMTSGIPTGPITGDFTIEADEAVLSGSARVGIQFCRRDSNNQYAFYMLYGGGWTLGKMENGSWTGLAMKSSDPNLKGGSSYNTIKIVRRGKVIEVYANGNLLVSKEDSTYNAGYFHLSAELGTSGYDMEVAFDNVKVTKP